MNTILAVLIVVFLAGIMLYRPQTVLFFLMTTATVKFWVMYEMPFFRTVDYTLLVCLVAAVAALWNWIKSPQSEYKRYFPVSVLVMFLGISFSMAFSLAWTTAPNYGLQKTLYFTFIGIPYFLIPFFLIRNSKNAAGVINIILITAIIACSVSIIKPQTECMRRFILKVLPEPLSLEVHLNCLAR